MFLSQFIFVKVFILHPFTLIGEIKDNYSYKNMGIFSLNFYNIILMCKLLTKYFHYKILFKGE